MGKITITLNDSVKARVEAKISTTIEEWIVTKLRTMAVYDDLAHFSVDRSDADERQRQIEDAQALEAEKQRLIAELEA
jgi:hypothetical protein